MTQAIAPALTPAPRGLEREEPELAEEDDIPSDGKDEALEKVAE
ncbi:hypothetical protein [Caenimonas aquaedulcis]|nr:hypothetical protein [Caenimonas aquaedulcis]